VQPEHTEDALQVEQPIGQVAQVLDGLSGNVPAGQRAAATQEPLDRKLMVQVRQKADEVQFPQG